MIMAAFWSTPEDGDSFRRSPGTKRSQRAYEQRSQEAGLENAVLNLGQMEPTIPNEHVHETASSSANDHDHDGPHHFHGCNISPFNQDFSFRLLAEIDYTSNRLRCSRFSYPFHA
jgi:hypothetical protein